VVAYEQKGLFADALADIAKTHPSPDDPWTISELAGIYGRTGQQSQARLWLAKLQALDRRQPLDPGAFLRPSIAWITRNKHLNRWNGHTLSMPT